MVDLFIFVFLYNPYNDKYLSLLVKAKIDKSNYLVKEDAFVRVGIYLSNFSSLINWLKIRFLVSNFSLVYGGRLKSPIHPNDRN